MKTQRESRQTSQQRNQPELNLNAQDKNINYADIADMITSAKNDIILHIDQSVEKIQNSINAATIAREPNVNSSTNVNTMRDTLIANMSNNNRFKESRIKQPKRRNGEYAPDKVKALFKQELEGKYSMEHVISVLYTEFDDQCVEVMHTYIEMLKQQNSEDMPVWSNISPHNRRVMCSIVSDAAIAYSENLAFLNDCENSWPAYFLLSTKWPQKVSNYKISR